MKLIGGTIAALALAAATVGAQSTTVKEKTKVEVKGGKDMTITGCLERNPNGTYVVTDRHGDLKYALVTDDDLSKHVGHLVEAKGKAADRGDGKVKVERSVGTGGEKTETKTEMSGKATDLPYFGLDSLKTLTDSCN